MMVEPGVGDTEAGLDDTTETGVGEVVTSR
jgi:hypothetical protein